MIGSDGSPPRFSLWRWSQRKLAAKAKPVPPAPPAASPPATAPAAAPAPELPPVESLCLDSDFTAFLRPEVDDTIRRAALKQLFRDPRFNVMDGLDTYIDDYTKADPIAPDVLADLLQRGFGRAAETGDEAAAGVANPAAGPGVTGAAPSATAEDQPALPASGNAGAPASRCAEETDPGPGEPTRQKGTDA